ncbi:MAG: hypothetical protein HC881_15955 [Leptolyngbyaceae cyanobacterium SL_7_1]|nr:hypothetical protein [Leptolyngbyaceae cyanobacterium SL_7_1]
MSSFSCRYPLCDRHQLFQLFQLILNNDCYPTILLPSARIILLSFDR